jgi:hypothetical protein
MTWAAWILENQQSLYLIALGSLLLISKLPFVSHNTLLEGIVTAVIGGVKKETEQAPIVASDVKK